jgi:hypothetical protein
VERKKSESEKGERDLEVQDEAADGEVVALLAHLVAAVVHHALADALAAARAVRVGRKIVRVGLGENECAVGKILWRGVRRDAGVSVRPGGREEKGWRRRNGDGIRGWPFLAWIGAAGENHIWKGKGSVQGSACLLAILHGARFLLARSHADRPGSGFWGRKTCICDPRLVSVTVVVSE